MTTAPDKAAHGGPRPGAGRPRKVPAKPSDPAAPALSAQEYLERVVSGQEAPDAVRTRAALGLIRYQRPAERAPMPAPPAAELSKKAVQAADTAIANEFEKRAAEIRARHLKRKT